MGVPRGRGPRVPSPAAGAPGVALALVASAQFVLILDLTIVTVALPTIGSELGFRSADLQWLVTAYALTFGGFLLLAGRAADIFGHRRMFIAGMLLFGAASLAAGLAVNELMLVGGRAAQGLGAAFASPAALALLTTTFREGRERNRALAIFGAVASAGAACGLVLGGVLTDWVGWRWVFLINVPLTTATAIAALRVFREVRHEAGHGLDLPGATTITLALVCALLGITRVERAGFGDTGTIAALAGAAVLGGAFLLLERGRDDPLVPIRLLRLRTVLGTDVTSSAASALIAATPFFLTLYLQRVLELTPVQTGFAFLPMALVVMATSAVAARLAEPIGVKPLLLSGLGALIAGSLLLSRLPVDGTYASDVLPGLAVFSVGLALSYTTTTIGGTAGVADADQGVAGGLLNTANQIGGAVGLAVLATVAAGATDGATGSPDARLVAGLQSAFLAALVFAAIGVVTAAALIRESDCRREVARRQVGDGVSLDATATGCLAGLRGQVIDAPLTGRGA